MIPGTILTCSMPKSSSTGHKQSANCVDKTRIPNEAFGATLFAAMANAKCPRNIAPHYDHPAFGCQQRSAARS